MAKKGEKKGEKKGSDADYIDCPREADDPHMRGEGFGPASDDKRGADDAYMMEDY